MTRLGLGVWSARPVSTATVARRQAGVSACEDNLDLTCNPCAGPGSVGVLLPA